MNRGALRKRKPRSIPVGFEHLLVAKDDPFGVVGGDDVSVHSPLPFPAWFKSR